jgi:uncharacterized protein (DUF1697 family)
MVLKLTARIALLRAVNVAGHATIEMAKLRALLTALGFEEPRTLLQSGNLVFCGGSGDDAAVEQQLEREAAKRLGVSTDVFVRTADEWRQLIKRNPFEDEAEHEPRLLHVVLLKDAVKAPAVAALQASVKGPEQIAGHGRHIYVTYPNGSGRSKLTIAAIEKELGTRGTARNWNTVLKLDAFASPG